MSTAFSTHKMRRGTVRSSPLTVPRTTVQRSTSRSSQSTVPRTTVRTSTHSNKQQQLREASACLPTIGPYGYGRTVQLLHPRVTSLQEEYLPTDNTTSMGPTDSNNPSPSFLLEVHTGSCRKRVQPSPGALHQITIKS